MCTMPLQRRGPHGLTQQEHIKYFQDRVAPTVEDLTLDIIIEQPEELVPSMIKWLSEYTKNYVPGALEHERLSNEISALSADIAALEAQLAVQPPREAEDRSQQQLKDKAHGALRTALLGEDYEDEFEEDENADLRDKAQDALQAALLGRSQEGFRVSSPAHWSAVETEHEKIGHDLRGKHEGAAHELLPRQASAMEGSADDDALRRKARGSLSVALLGQDYEDDFEDDDIEVQQESREKSEEAYVQQLKQKAKGAVSSVLLGEDCEDEFEEDKEEEDLQGKAQQALEVALLGDDDLREKAQSALEASVLGDDDLRDKAQAALEASLLGDDNLKDKAQAALEAALVGDDDLRDKAQGALEVALLSSEGNDQQQARLEKSVTDYSMAFDEEEEFEEDFVEEDDDASEQSETEDDSQDGERKEVDMQRSHVEKSAASGNELSITLGSTASVNVMPPEKERAPSLSDDGEKGELRRSSNMRPPSRSKTNSLDGTVKSLEGMMLSSIPLDANLLGTAQTANSTGADSSAPTTTEGLLEVELEAPKKRSLLPLKHRTNK